jgi:DNA-binding transcriptional ArsR family regulator
MEQTSIPPLIPAQMGARSIIDGQQRCYSNNYSDGGDDDEGQDLREQKSAFLRALETNKAKSTMGGGRLEKTSSERSLKARRQTAASHRRRNHKSGSRTTTSATTSKKLTLDEFFSNLEKTKADESSLNLTTRKRPRARITSKRQFHPQNDNRGGKSRAKGREAPAADMGSFFEKVNALMDRKESGEEELQQTTRKSLKNDISSPASMPNFRASLTDLIPQRSSATNTSSKDDGIVSRREDGNSSYYSCSVESLEEYIELLEDVMEGPKFLTRLHSKKEKNKVDDAKKTHQIGQLVHWLRSDKPLVDIRLPTLDSALKGENSDGSEEPGNYVEGSSDDDGTTTSTKSIYTSRGKLFRDELNAQRERFMNDMGWTKKQYDVATGALVAMGSLCAKNCTAPPLDVAWSKLKELGYPMNNKDVLHNFLYVASTFSLPKRKSYVAKKNVDILGIFDSGRMNIDAYGDDGLSSSASDSLRGRTHSFSSSGGDDAEENEVDVSAEVALCHDFLHKATEQSTGIHVRRLVQLGKANEAERLLDVTMVR